MTTYLSMFIPVILAIIGMLVHIETSIASLKTDVRWIKHELNKHNNEEENEVKA